MSKAIKMGAVVATRGPAATQGSSFVKAIQLAEEELKNTAHQYELAIEEIPAVWVIKNGKPTLRVSNATGGRR